MATGASVTNLDAIIKEGWVASGDVKTTFARACPVLDMFKKVCSLSSEGKYTVEPIITDAAQAFTAGDTFIDGWNASANTYDKISKFQITPKEHYCFSQIDGLTMATTNKRSKGFIDAIMHASNNMVKDASQKIDKLLFGGGLGKIGTSASSSGAVLTLTNRWDALNFRRDMFVVFAADDASAIRTVAAGGLQVTATNLNLGTVTFNQTITTGATSAGQTDSLYISTLRPTGATPAAKVLQGFEAWGPATDPTSTSFNNVDRSVDPSLYMQRVGGQGLTWRERLNTAQAVSMAFGGSTTERRVLAVHPTAYGQILNEMGLQVQYAEIKTNNLTFNGARVNDGTEIIPAHNCGPNDSWYLQPSDWDLVTRTEDVVELGNQIGQTLVQVNASKGYILQGRAIVDIGCRLPGAQVRIQHNVAPQAS